MKNLLIDILAFGAILSSVLVITSKNPVIAVIFLISVFVNAAGYLLLLGIGFIGISYIIVYIGAIAVLFLFVIMMINIKLTDILEVGSTYTKNLPLALAVGALFIYEVITISSINLYPIKLIELPSYFITYLNSFLLGIPVKPITPIHITLDPIIADSSITQFLQIEVLGHNLYTYGALWLIITSIILLLAMIAPIILSRNKSHA